MSAIKLYLIIGKNSQLEEIITFRDLDSLKQEWSDRSDTGKTAIIHCGFLRPRIDNRMELPENLSGKVLYSGAMKWALPETYNSSVDTVTYIEMDNMKTPCYLALNQWGYEVEEQEAVPVLIHNDSQAGMNADPIPPCPIDDLNLSLQAENSSEQARSKSTTNPERVMEKNFASALAAEKASKSTASPERVMEAQVLLRDLPANIKTMAARIRILARCGFNRVEIASATGASYGVVWNCLKKTMR